MSDEIRTREEDGVMVFEKDKISDLEAKFYNPAYFSMIGFPDAEIMLVNKITGEPVEPLSLSVENGSNESLQDESQSVNTAYPTSINSNDAPNDEQLIERESNATTTSEIDQSNPNLDSNNNASEDGQSELTTRLFEDANSSMLVNKTKGGHYANVPNLTTPFQYFVYLVQPKSQPPREYLTPEKPTPTDTPAFYSGLNSFFDRVKNTFKRTPTDKNTIVSPSTPTAVAAEPHSEEDPSDTSTPTPTPTPVLVPNQDEDVSLMWVVKIKIEGESSEANEAMTAETELNDAIREHNANKINHIIITGKRFNVGARTIKIAQTVEEGEPIPEYPKSKLVGTKMYKYGSTFGV